MGETETEQRKESKQKYKTNQKKKKRNGKKVRKHNKREKKYRKRCRQATGKCLENAVTAMNRWLRVVSNYKKQSARSRARRLLLTRKRAKKDCLVPFSTSWCLQ